MDTIYFFEIGSEGWFAKVTGTKLGPLVDCVNMWLPRLSHMRIVSMSTTWKGFGQRVRAIDGCIEAETIIDPVHEGYIIKIKR